MNRLADQLILLSHRQLQIHFGPLQWWPAESPFEVAVGAILTQNTAWANVERAIQNLKREKALSPGKLVEIPVSQLEDIIRPAGFFRQKTQSLLNLANHLIREWQNDLLALCGGPLDEARTRLLALKGIGPETADAILLYAAGRPIFVVDAYTKRIFHRLGLLNGHEKYERVQQIFMQALPEDDEIYNEFHAEIVQLGKVYCRKKKPLCSNCPLKQTCYFANSNLKTSL